MKTFRWVLLCALVLCLSTALFAQSTATAELRGEVKDPAGAVVSGATVRLIDESRNFEQTATTNAEGSYTFLLVRPGMYTLSVEAPGFAKQTKKGVVLTVGQQAELPISLTVSGGAEQVDVVADAALVETTRTAVATTIDERRIENLPINERNYLGFALTTSMVSRDNGRPIGPAPTSGLNIGGQRGRSTLVQVDGADNTDTSINAARSTLSQEAVQEFQVITNSYAAEFGRAAGGVINVVSKGGTNDVRGNLFGFLRHRSFQANNRFSPVDDAPFTRVQYGATLGGPLVKDRTFYFASFEQRRRQESGFFTTDVVGPLTQSFTLPAIPGINPASITFNNLTAAQVQFMNAAVSSGVAANICAARAYGFMASSGGQIGLNGASTLRSPNDGSACPAISPILPGAIGGRFLLSGAPVPASVTNAAGQPIAFRPLTLLQRIFPIKEETTYSSLRVDHEFNHNHRLTLRGGYNPSVVTGIQVESQNQALGQNDFSRTGIQELHDTSAVAVLNSIFGSNLVNEARFSFGQRVAGFKSQNGDAVAVNIGGTAFFGRELFSPVQRTEKRFQLTDSLSWLAGKHNFKFGADVNFVDVAALFELNFAGLFNFGGLTASTLGFPVGTPDFTPVQQYGLGFPANYIQGFGNPRSSLSNQPLAFFAQDSWRIRQNLTLNYGVRYDLELTAKINPVSFTDPLTRIALSETDILSAQEALNVQQGVPRDTNNIAPRLALAWDPWNNQRTVVRAAYGMFYDHPLQAIAFNSDIADAAQQQQFVALPGSPSPTAALNAVQIFQGTVIPGVTPGVASSAQYQAGRMRFNDQTFPGFGPVLPFTLHVDKSFEYAYAHQANFTIEQELSKDFSVSASYLWVGGRHLPRPLDVNAPQNNLTVGNFQRLSGRAPLSTTEALAFSIPTTGAPCPGGVPLQCYTMTTPAGTPVPYATAGQTYAIIVPGMVTAPLASLNSRIVNPAIANFFRPSGPNYFLAAASSGGLVSKAVLDNAMSGSLRTAGVLSPFGSVNAQVSNGNSDYNALTLELRKRFSQSYQFLASYTWSHAIDESSDLHTLLLPQDNYNVAAERSNSLFDQRHRFVFSGMISAPPSWSDIGGFRRFFSGFTVAPILELSSGRPFNILTGIDTNNDQSNQTDRPNVGPDGTLTLPTAFSSGTLGRNAGITQGYASLDMRVTRSFAFSERMRFDVIAEGFNLFNRVNEASVSPFFTDVNALGLREGNAYRSRATAAFDPRQFQFGLKLNF